MSQSTLNADSKDDSKLAEALAREIPHNIEAEQAVLGAILTNNEALNRVGEYLQPEHFYEPVHQRIYQAILMQIERGFIANPVTLKTVFDKDGALSDIGGADYLVRLANQLTSIINLESYGKTVYDLFIRRKLVGVGEDIVNDAYEKELDRSAQQQIEFAENVLFNLATEGASESGFQSLKEALADAIKTADSAHRRKEKISGIPTDFIDLDSMLGGYQNSDLVILAGRPSMGKTAVAINMAVNCCKNLKARGDENHAHPPSVGFFSLEMSSEQIATRMIAMESGVSSASMRQGSLNDDEFRKVVDGNRALYELPFFIDDTPALSISALRTRARRLKRKNNLALLIIDYLQLLRGSSKASEQSRVQEVSEITQGLKAIAKELNIPVIALSQLSRAVEQRPDKRPQLSDLRESGSIEQDADIVMFIYREEYYVEREKPAEGSEEFANWQAKMDACMNISELIVAKHRNGPIGSARIFFDGSTTKFKNLEQAQYGEMLPG